jgi:hypothetical protein
LKQYIQQHARLEIDASSTIQKAWRAHRARCIAECDWANSDVASIIVSFM